jgi:ketosteroid isomerase-like protein
MSIARCTMIAGALAAWTACRPTSRPLTAADEIAIRSADSAIVAAINAGDGEAATAGYAADGIVMPPNAVAATGSDGIRQFWTRLSGMMNVHLVCNSERMGGDGNVAYHIGSYHLTATLKDSTHASVPSEDGKYLQVFVRQPDGSWKEVAEAWNANPAPAPPRPPPTRTR